ncbi:(deoxy)nucleoside triphosphate pyrophosphohydrolase [Bacillus sp. FJAT-49754]|nr:(deoxy)nucleoside triphosphate pyrophosphohydrolase [Lederbergia citrea]
MKKHIFVVGAVITENEKILCAQRGPSKSLPLKWEFPGGKIEEGESPQEALHREISEEMQCKIEIGEQVEQTAYEYVFGIVHLTTFHCKLIEGQPALTEHVAIKWLLPTELTSLDWAPADIPTIEKIMMKSLVNESGKRVSDPQCGKASPCWGTGT